MYVVKVQNVIFIYNFVYKVYFYTYVLVDYAIYQNTNPAFDFVTKSNYKLDVECIDEHGGTSLTKSLFVYILKNQPPVITNLQG